MEKNPTVWRKIENDVVQSEEFIVKENHSYNVSVLINQEQVFKNDHHHHHIALVARISLTLSRHSSLSFIALGRSSGQHPVSSHSC